MEAWIQYDLLWKFRESISMIESYRKATDSRIWHFCPNCTTYPANDYVSALLLERGADVELCTECVARHSMGECGDQSDSLEKRKCPVFVEGKQCGFELRQELSTGVHLCPAGHRVLVVPPSTKAD